MLNLFMLLVKISSLQGLIFFGESLIRLELVLMVAWLCYFDGFCVRLFFVNCVKWVYIVFECMNFWNVYIIKILACWYNNSMLPSWNFFTKSQTPNSYVQLVGIPNVQLLDIFLVRILLDSLWDFIINFIVVGEFLIHVSCPWFYWIVLEIVETSSWLCCFGERFFVTKEARKF